jgi:hypothetical protein
MKTSATKRKVRPAETPRGTVPDVPIPESWQLVVECRGERDQRLLYERLTQEGYACRVLTL